MDEIVEHESIMKALKDQLRLAMATIDGKKEHLKAEEGQGGRAN